MARIVKLAELLPEDIVFELPGGARHTFPGDPPLHLIIKIASLFERAEGSEDSQNGDSGVGMEVLEQLDAEVLRLLQMRDPAIVASPFGVMAVQHVVAQLLSAYNFGVEDEEVDEDGVPPRPRSRSTQSSGSRSSSKGSGSPRTTGKR